MDKQREETQPGESRPWEVPHLLPGALCAVFFTLACLRQINWRMGNDEGMWHYVSWLWLNHGVPPYSGAIENKTPGIFILFAGCQWISGMNLWLPRLIGCCAACGSIWLIFKLGARMHSSFAGLLAMVMLGGSLCWAATDGDRLVYTETFQIFFAVLGFWIVLKGQGYGGWTRRLYMVPAGLALGLSVAFKQVGVFSAAALAVWVVLPPAKDATKRQAMTDLSLLILGSVVGTGLSIVPLLLSGASLGGYWYGAWQLLLTGGTAGASGSRVTGFLDSFWSENSRMGLFYPGLIYFVWKLKPLKSGNVPVFVLLAWALLDFVGANASGRYYPHQLRQILPSWALICGISIAHFVESLEGGTVRQPRLRTACIILLLVLFLPYVNPTVIKRTRRPSVPYFEQQLAGWIAQHSDSHECVLIHAGNAGKILVLAQRKAPSRFFNTQFLTAPGAEAEYREAARKSKPRMIVVDSGAPEWLRSILDSDYLLANSFSESADSSKPDQWEAYLRK